LEALTFEHLDLVGAKFAPQGVGDFRGKSLDPDTDTVSGDVHAELNERDALVEELLRSGFDSSENRFERHQTVLHAGHDSHRDPTAGGRVNLFNDGYEGWIRDRDIHLESPITTASDAGERAGGFRSQSRVERPVERRKW